MAILTGLVTGPAWAQVEDGTTPPGHAPGAPAGSYALSDFDNINFFNGNLNFRLPLVTVGGRGEAGYTAMLSIEQHWGVELNDDESPLAFPRFNWWRGTRPGYGPGTMVPYRTVDGGPVFFFGLTRYTFTAPDGTQHEFRDDAFEGRFNQVLPQPNPPFNRGRVFRTHDGSQLTFLADGDVFDVGEAPVDGHLMFPNGIRYRIERDSLSGIGLVRWIQDRNGNVVRFEYAPHPELGPQVSVVTDPLNRVVEFDYLELGNPVTTRYDTVTFKGWGAAPRVLRVDYALLEDRLVDSAAPQALGQLFSAIGWGSPGEVHNPWVVSSVSLPNGRAYSFRYNAYGELAEVELPTGGQYRYSYGPGVSNPLDDGGTVGGANAIYRRVRQKSVYEGANEVMRMTMELEEYEGVAASDVRITASHWDPVSDPAVLLSRERHYFRGRASQSLVSPPSGYPRWETGREYRSEILDAEDVVLRAVHRTWQQAARVSWAPSDTESPLNEPRVTAETTVLENGQLARVTRDYYTVFRGSLQYDNLRDTREYALDAPEGSPPVRRRHLDYVTSAAYVGDGVHLRGLVSREETFEVVGPNEFLASRASYDYDSHPEGLVPRSSISGRQAPEDRGTGFTTRGNVTAVRRWLSTTGTELVSQRRYDIAGNVVKETAPRSCSAAGCSTTTFSTTFEYADNFGSPDGVITGATRPPELPAPLSTFAFVSQTINPLSHATRTQTEYYLGRPVDAEDANGVVTSFWFDDSLDRLTRVIQANSPGHEAARSRKGFAYDDSVRTVTTVADKDGFNDQQYRSQAVYDTLGREAASRTYEGSGPQQYVEVAKGYDARGRLAAVSNPYRPGEIQRWTDTHFDALGRQTVQTLPDESQVATSYAGTTVTVTDQANKKRTSTSDALGRLVSLVEDPGGLNYVTSYSYDALDNLRTVTQTGQTRSFGYDSLSRLTSETTPEAGTTTYDYDRNGNLVTRTDARNVITCWGTLTGSSCANGYDALDRPTRKTYSDGTPQVTYAYDAGPPYGRGRLVSVANSVSTTAVAAYDPLGRVTGAVQTTDGTAYPMAYGYDRSGLLVGQAYPSGRTVFTARDLAGRVFQVAEQGQLYATAAQYFPHGAPSGLLLGNGRWESAAYNERLQPRYLGLGSTSGVRDVLQVENRYFDPAAPSQNNGNVLKQVVSLPGAAFTQDFTYDAANRLQTATEGSAWSQTYSYDRFGNRATTGSRPNPEHTPTALSHFTANTNRINTSFDGDIAYDSAGNLRVDAAARNMTYDAENRQTSVGSTAYAYDGEGRRVRKTVGGVTTVFVYDAMGKLVGEYGPGPIPQLFFVTQDHLGSTRLATDAGGNVVGRWDYLPFGEEIPTTYGGRGATPGYGSDPGIRQKFTGKERDIETGLDYFEARYDSGAQGRFQSVDPVSESGVHVADPQQWNRYSYVRNNPLKLVDPDGRSATVAGAVIGGALGAGAAWAQGKSGREILAAAGRGAVSGGMIGLVIDSGGTAALGVGGWMLAGGLSNVAGGATESAILGQGYSSTAAALDFAFGMATGPAGTLAGGPQPLGSLSTAARGSLRPLARSLGAAGDDLLLKKAVNSNLPHAIERGVERGIFDSADEAGTALRALTDQITKTGAFPAGTLVDTANASRFLVPVGNNGLAVYQLGANGTAKLKTVLVAR